MENNVLHRMFLELHGEYQELKEENFKLKKQLDEALNRKKTVSTEKRNWVN